MLQEKLFVLLFTNLPIKCKIVAAGNEEMDGEANES